jgi:hypothetical protein
MAAFIREYGLTDIVCWAVPPGLRPDQMAPHLQRYAQELVPRLKAMFPGTAAGFSAAAGAAI